MPYFYYYGFDMTYIVLVLPFVILSIWASTNVNSTFRKYSQQLSRRHITGAEAAQRVLSANGVTGVKIERIGGNLTDHFDPRTNVIRLSDDVFDSTPPPPSVLPATKQAMRCSMPSTMAPSSYVPLLFP